MFKYKCPNISSCLQVDILLSQLSLFNIEVFAGHYEISEAKFLTGNRSSHTSQLLGLKRLSGCALQTWHRHSLIVLSPCHPGNPSKIRLEVANPSVHIILGSGKFPWLNINKGPTCETYVTF